MDSGLSGSNPQRSCSDPIQMPSCVSHPTTNTPGTSRGGHGGFVECPDLPGKLELAVTPCYREGRLKTRGELVAFNAGQSRMR